MLRIAEAPASDVENEGKTLTPYWAAELLDVRLGFFIWCIESNWVLQNNCFEVYGYTFEILRGKQSD